MAGVVTTPDLAVTGTARHVPGEAGIWLLVLAEMCVFSVLFVVFALARGHDVAGFDHSRGSLHVAFGLANTLLLLSSSYYVARAVGRIRSGSRSADVTTALAIAATLGAVFLVNKGFEWHLELAAGNRPVAGGFYMYFFVYTIIHAVHVTIGVVLLLYLRRLVLFDLHPPAVITRRAESIATFWHMVDLIWVVLFMLLYLA